MDETDPTITEAETNSFFITRVMEQFGNRFGVTLTQTQRRVMRTEMRTETLRAARAHGAAGAPRAALTCVSNDLQHIGPAYSFTLLPDREN